MKHFKSVLLRRAQRFVRTGSARGFSLIEVLIAMALLSVVILSTMGVLVVGLHRVYGGRKMTEAAVLAQDVLQRTNRPAAYLFFDAPADTRSVQQIWETGQTGGVGYRRTQRIRTDGAGTVTTETPINFATAWETAGASPTNNYGASFGTRNLVGDLFTNSRLPYGETAANEAEILVRADAVPDGTTFNNARMARVQVQVRWSERGTRPRQVRMESLTLPLPEN